MNIRPTGRIKTHLEDFVVDEIPAYEPSGTGEHLFVHFRKRGRTTDSAVRAIAEALAVDMRNVGVAGLKDKAAVTTQWISLLTREAGVEDRAKGLDLDGIEVLDAKKHGNKLKTGHLRANRFEIVIRNVSPDALKEVLEAFERIARDGVPNAFGSQRFGTKGDTAEQARAWLTGKARAPNNPRLRRFHFSAFQSMIFNAVLDARVEDGTWNVPQEGDLLKKEEGGLFLCTDVQTDRARAVAGEVCPTGPLVGDKMRKPEGAIAALEERISTPLLEGIDLHRARALGEGTRRALRLRVGDLTVVQSMERESEEIREQGCTVSVRFVLPKGAFATTVLSNAIQVVEERKGPPDGAGSGETTADGEVEGEIEER